MIADNESSATCPQRGLRFGIMFLKKLFERALKIELRGDARTGQRYGLR
jgi:hypothetical protein